jgi:hypothetical protein
LVGWLVGGAVGLKADARERIGFVHFAKKNG